MYSGAEVLTTMEDMTSAQTDEDTDTWVHRFASPDVDGVTSWTLWRTRSKVWTKLLELHN